MTIMTRELAKQEAQALVQAQSALKQAEQAVGAAEAATAAAAPTQDTPAETGPGGNTRPTGQPSVAETMAAVAAAMKKEGK